MTMQPVKSSNLTHVGHHGETLHVTFKGGVKYSYRPVTADQFQQLLDAESKGKFLLSLGIKGVKL